MRPGPVCGDRAAGAPTAPYARTTGTSARHNPLDLTSLDGPRMPYRPPPVRVPQVTFEGREFCP
ncbi:hypothetical protein SNE510_08830 [Streptomyces sp. NE5-10]|nr:hypothetical protein SNE510_08830 [Streptomyces sp. NE5-10]